MDKIGRYAIISELGRGAMGIVYKASDPMIDREVALKVLSITSSSEEGTNSPQQMFMREVRAAGRLSHPSIITIHDAFDDPESKMSCIVMELVPGMTLEKILESGHKLTIDQILNVARQVADGLDFAHRNQVIHRDLKPANILVAGDGHIKITDFGIAKVLAREGAVRTVGVMGTPSYMSPEQVRGSDVDARSDIFSFGIILFTMLSGKKPFAGNTAAVMFKIVYEEPPAPSTLNPELSAAHDYVVKKCLAKDRKNRYNSARELIGDLNDLQNGRPPGSQAAASMEKTVAMTIPVAVKKAPPQSAPPPATSGKPVDPASLAPTVAMPISELRKAGGQPPAPPNPNVAPAPPQAAAPPVPPAVPVAFQPTVAMPISELMKAAGQQPVASFTAPKPNAAPPVKPTSPVPPKATLVMPPMSELLRSAPQPPAPPKPAGAPPVKPAVPAVKPPDAAGPGPTVALPISGLIAPSTQQSAPRPAPPPAVPPSALSPTAPPVAGTPLAGQTLVMHALDFAAMEAAIPQAAVPEAFTPHVPQPPPAAPLHDEPTMMDHTLPLRVPNLSDLPPAPVSAPAPSAAPAPPVLPPRPVAKAPKPTPIQMPDFSYKPPDPVPESAGPALPPEIFANQGQQPAPPPPRPASKSMLIPALLGGAFLFIVAGGGLVYWGVHRSASTPSQAAVQAPIAANPAETTPYVPPAAETAPPAAQPSAPPVSTPSEAAAKPVTKKPKQAATSHKAQPEAPAPAPEPQPVAVTQPAAPVPVVAVPVAKPEAPKIAEGPRIVNIVCVYDLKEATFTFSSGGQSLYSETAKGKKVKKEGFLGIKGSYQGNLNHTLTVPAGASDVSIHVVSKDGNTDLNQSLKMPPAGGFIPTLAINVDSEHLSANWKSSSSGQ